MLVGVGRRRDAALRTQVPSAGLGVGLGWLLDLNGVVDDQVHELIKTLQWGLVLVAQM